MDTFTAGSCIRFGWETFKKRPWFFIGAYLVFFIVVGVVTEALNELTHLGALLAILAVIIRIAFEVLIGMGGISFALKAHDNIEHVAIKDFWRPNPFWKYLGATLLFAIIFLVGLLLILIPGIIWAIMFGFAGYLVIDKHLWPIEALKESKRITRGSRWELFLLGILSIVIMLLGAICLGVGILVAYPIVALAVVHAFRTLEQKAGTSAPAA